MERRGIGQYNTNQTMWILMSLQNKWWVLFEIAQGHRKNLCGRGWGSAIVTSWTQSTKASIRAKPKNGCEASSGMGFHWTEWTQDSKRLDVKVAKMSDSHSNASNKQFTTFKGAVQCDGIVWIAPKRIMRSHKGAKILHNWPGKGWSKSRRMTTQQMSIARGAWAIATRGLNDQTEGQCRPRGSAMELQLMFKQSECYAGGGERMLTE